jgi:ATP-dependent helicase/nuclease subunit A
MTDTETGWYALIRDALEPDCRRVESADGELVALEWRAAQVTPVQTSDKAADVAEEAPLPRWVDKPAKPPAPGGRRIAPSTVRRDDEESAAFGPPTVGTSGKPVEIAALERGRLIHRLLQALPDHPPDMRREIGERYLAATAPDLADAGIIDGITEILDDPRFAPLFGPDSRAEVEIAGRLEGAGDGAIVSGRIDRLAVTDKGVFIVDFKTNRPAPRKLTDVPRDYVTQLSLYWRILTRLYPDRPVVAALLWTDVPALMEVPEAMLKAAESRLVDA